MGGIHGALPRPGTGPHEVTLACKQTGATLEASFFVQGGPSSGSAAPRGPMCWKRSPGSRGGKVIASIGWMRCSARWRRFRTRPRRCVGSIVVSSGRGSGVVVLLGVFWVGRKSIGLI